MKSKTLLLIAAACSLPVFAGDIAVPAGGNLQAALNKAQPGDSVTLAAGASYVGHFYLAANAGPQTITIQSSAMSSLPGAGSRVSNTNSAAMPKLISSDGNAALVIPSGANYYKIQGIEVAPASGVYGQDLVQVGTASETSIGALPHDIDFDRVYVHGDPSAGSKRGIALNGGSTTVENSYFSGFTSTTQDTQALCGWNGPGPYNIVNNYLEAGTETVAFGGAPTAIPGVIPSDIVIRGNNFFKPLSWMAGSNTYAGKKIWVKNHIEFKNAQRVTIDNNTFENNWVGADQRGFAFVFQVRTEYGNVPWATVSNITLTNNRIRHSAAGADFGSVDDSSPNPGTSFGFTVKNNVWEDISSNWGGDGRLFQLTGGMKTMTFDHNTSFQTGYIAVFDSGQSSNINFTNNIFLSGGGVAGNSTQVGTPTLNYWDQGGSFLKNVLVGASASAYPANNYFPSTVSAVGFVDYANANYQLSASSAYKNAATDSTDLGYSAAGSTTPTPTPTPTPNIPTGWVNVVSKNSGKCLDITGISLSIAAGTQQWLCWGGDNQKFQFSPVSGGYEVTAKHSGQQLDVAGGSTADGAIVIQYPFWGGANEIWLVNPTSDGYYTITSKNSGKCLDVSGISKNDGAPVQQWSCWGGDNQKWSLVSTQ